MTDNALSDAFAQIRIPTFRKSKNKETLAMETLEQNGDLQVLVNGQFEEPTSIP